jgi:hypothetical protein
MSQRIRRSLAVCLLTAFSLALPLPSQAAGLLDTAAPSVWMARAWSWLESLGLVSQPAPRPQREKSGLAAPGETSSLAEPPPGDGGPFQGSGIDPNGTR